LTRSGVFFMKDPSIICPFQPLFFFSATNFPNKHRIASVLTKPLQHATFFFLRPYFFSSSPQKVLPPPEVLLPPHSPIPWFATSLGVPILALSFHVLASEGPADIVGTALTSRDFLFFQFLCLAILSRCIPPLRVRYPPPPTWGPPFL